MVLKNISASYVGSTPVTKIYLGGVVVYEVASGVSIIYTMDTINTDATTKQRTLDNTGTTGDTDDAPANASSGVFLNGTNQEIPISIVDGVTLAILYQNPVDGIWHTITGLSGTSYAMTQSAIDIVPLTVIPTQNDLDYLEANPDDLRNMAFDDVIAGLSFTKSNMQKFYSCSEGKEGVYDVYNILDSTSVAIVNPTTACITTYKNQDIGASNLHFKQDANGMLTGKMTGGEIAGSDDGRSILLPLDAPLDYAVTKDIKHIEGDSMELTITFSDDSTAVVPDLVALFTLDTAGRLLSYSYNDGENHATLEDDPASAAGYLIINMVTEIDKDYIVSVQPDVVNTPSQSYYRNRILISGEQTPLSNQGTDLKQELTFKATEAITPLYLYAENVLITYSDISLRATHQ